MKIRLLSDLHTELHPIVLNFKKHADVVILAGDIGNPYHDNYINLLNKLSLTHEKVFVVSGNHEYYNNNIEETDLYLSNLCEDNVHFLQKQSIIYKNVKFIGCTLWSDPDQSLCKYINDFAKIQNFTYDKYKSLHLNHKEWLEHELLNNYKNCVITHYLPLNKLTNEQFINHPLHSFFSSDINTTGADYWFYGHTHVGNQMEIENVKFHCNPRGYSHESTGFNMDYIIGI